MSWVKAQQSLLQVFALEMQRSMLVVRARLLAVSKTLRGPEISKHRAPWP